MQDGTALRNISKLFGQSYKTGEIIPGEVLARMSSQSLRAAVNNKDIDVAGMEADGGAMGQHLKAKMDRLEAEHKKLLSSNAVLQQSHDNLSARIQKLEAAVTQLLQPAKAKPTSRREAAAAQE